MVLTLTQRIITAIPYQFARFAILSPEYSQMLENRDRFLDMTLEEKRMQYTCKTYYTLENVETWVETYRKDTNRLLDIKEKILSTAQVKDLKKRGVNSDFNKKISIWKGDITCLEIDAIVNAANNSLLGGGGVDGAIHKAAGSSLLEECKLLNGCETGDAKATGGYRLPAKYVFHTVGPRGEKPDLLASCYKKCLSLMTEKQLKSIAFPCISTGVYGYPQFNAANVVLKVIRDFMEKDQDKVDRIIFCLFMKEDVEIYEALMQIYFPNE